jgi:hypothetical protein
MEAWDNEWASIGLELRDMFLLPDDVQAWVCDILGPDMFDDLKRVYAPPPEVQPEPPDLIAPPEIWFEPLCPVVVLP